MTDFAEERKEARSRLLVIAVVVIALVLITFAFARQAHAQTAEIPLTPGQCVELSNIVKVAAELRDIDANMQKYIGAMHKKNPEIPQHLWDVVEREIVKAFNDGLPQEEVAQEFLVRCYKARGMMGVGS